MKTRKILSKNPSSFIDVNNICSHTTSNNMEVNEDAIFDLQLQSCFFLGVFDGVGSSETGEFVTQISIDAITRELKLYEFRPLKYAITQSLREANRLILLRKTKASYSEIGASFTGVLVRDREICLANIGNCRAYLLRDNVIQQLTTDHTYIQELKSHGISPSQEDLVERKHVLTRMLGAVPNVNISVFPLWIWDSKDCDVEGNDVIILCSDGLYEYINIQDVADKISNCAGNYKSVCEELTQEAIANGSKDNISIVTIPLIGQLRNVLPPGYNVSIDDSKEDSFDDDNYDSGIEEYQIDNNIYVLHLIILVILFNFISIMFFLVGLN